MASVFENKGYWHINVTILNEETGKKDRRRFSTGMKATKDNLKIAEDKYLKAVNEQEKSGQLIIPKISETVRSLGAQFIANKRQEDKVRAYTARSYERALEQHFYGKYGDKPVESFTEDDINVIQRKLLSNLSSKRVKNISIAFRGIFNLAYSKRIIAVNPYDKANPISDKKTHSKSIEDVKKLNMLLDNKHDEFGDAFDAHSKNKIDPFSEKELQLLIKTATGQFKNYIALAYLLGGVRPSELIALTWRKVDFEKGVVYILGAITGKETKDERHLNKSSSSVRKVLMSDLARKYLKAQYERTAKYNSAVFLNQYKKPYCSIQSLRDKSFKRLLRITKIRPRRLYDIRHSFASISLSSGKIPLTLVTKMMGHKDSRITLEKYSAYIADSEDETLELINQAYESFH